MEQGIVRWMKVGFRERGGEGGGEGEESEVGEVARGVDGGVGEIEVEEGSSFSSIMRRESERRKEMA